MAPALKCKRLSERQSQSTAAVFDDENHATDSVECGEHECMRNSRIHIPTTHH